MSLIDPNLLQLIGLGSTGDPDIADGRHLRWIFHRLLGFPRTGFRLTRRPSLLTLDFEAPPSGTPTIRSQLTRQAELGVGGRVRFPSGLTVSKAGGFVFGPAEAGGQPLLRLDNQPVSLDLGAEGAPPPTSGELLSNPAAYLLLTIARRSRSGFVVARGYYDGRPTLRPVDRAAVGGDLRSHLADLAAEIVTVGGTLRALSAAERRAGAGAVVRRDALASASVASRGLRPRWPRPPIVDPNPFVTETLLLHGGLLEHVDVRGHDANLLRVQWISTRDLLSARGWTELGRYFLPLTDAPDIYPAWTAGPGEKVAADRLHTSPPGRQPPWDRESGADPPLLLPSVPTPVGDSLDARYLGAEFKAVDVAMRELLRGELQQVVPQALVQVTERLEPEPGDGSGPEAIDVTLSPFDLLYGAAADPQVARELGLSAVDREDPAGIYDYAIEAGFATIWAQWLLQPRLGRDRADRLRAELGGRLADWQRRGPFTPFSIASVLTGLGQAPAASLEAPADLRADVVPDPTRSPVQARVRLHWARGATNLFEAPDRVRVLHVFKRVSDAGDLLLHHRDDETKLLAPHLPTPYGEPEPRLNLVDRSVPSYGLHTWKVAAMDLFGRISADAAVSADVRDTVPPPPPANVEAALLGDATAGPAWTGVAIAFDWLPSHEALAPDLSAFELHLRQGPVSSAEAPLPATWGALETTPGATAGAVRIAWPSLVASGVPAGVSLNASATPLQGGGHRVAFDVSPIAVPFDTAGYARVAAALRALDSGDNASGFAVARAERVDLTVPPPPTFAENALRATPADAQNRSWFRVALPSIPDASVRVLRASSVALLSASGTSAADFAALGEADQVGLLRTLAVSHREPFATDHEQPLPAVGGGYLMELGGFDRGLTVIHVAVENRTGARSAWPASPAAFLVIAVPRTSAPPPPLVRDVRVGDGSALVSIAPDVTGATRALALYRARDAADAADVRRMRPVAEITLPVPAPDEPTTVVDSGLYDEVEYFYRVVAIGDGGVRSAPTGAIGVRSVSHGPPPAPEVSAIERDPAQPDRRRVRLRVPRRDYPVFLFRRRQFAPAWETASGVGIGPDGRLDLAALVATPDPGGYQILVEDVVPVADAAWSYLARIEDPRGRATAGAPLMEAP